ncbi:HepT-like ribonuclease domain-containing protein [Luteococcus sp. H138]|uniref:HepT-like ribonuclease domain-containing protein n=1 Tax=unclassified Luteococcus TaxID=2639923 RepID=UPI00313BE24E
MTGHWREGQLSPEQTELQQLDAPRSVIKESAARLAALVALGEEEFMTNTMVQDAVCYLLIRVSEAAKDLPIEIKECATGWPTSMSGSTSTSSGMLPRPTSQN